MADTEGTVAAVEAARAVETVTRPKARAVDTGRRHGQGKASKERVTAVGARQLRPGSWTQAIEHGWLDPSGRWVAWWGAPHPSHVPHLLQVAPEDGEEDPLHPVAHQPGAQPPPQQPPQPVLLQDQGQGLGVGDGLGVGLALGLEDAGTVGDAVRGRGGAEADDRTAHKVHDSGVQEDQRWGLMQDLGTGDGDDEGVVHKVPGVMP
mmetsp:Transcript_89666/g.155240  ORF Transcript_89666/g.155240 Transcript_89666/m.155240 type:complete len:206 (+) Transcript_89666:81-698(+)